MECKGLLNIKCNLRWCESVHGKSYNIIIEKEKYTIHFPNLPINWKKDDSSIDHLHSPLLPPKIFASLRREKEPIEYGFPMSYPKVDSVIKLVGISFKSKENHWKEKSQKLYNNIDQWIEKLNKILNIMVDNKSCDLELTQIGNSLELYRVTKDGLKIINNDNCAKLIVPMHDHKNSIKDSQLRKAIELLNNNFELSESYDYYLEAKKSYEKKKYRQCVLDCATAVEISITNKIIERFNEKNIAISNNKLNKFKGLDSKKNLIKLFDDISEIDFKLITNPRNKAIHSGIIIDQNEALKCRIETKKLLDLFEKFY